MFSDLPALDCLKVRDVELEKDFCLVMKGIVTPSQNKKQRPARVDDDNVYDYME
jgi:hypothetical protein